MKRFAPIMLAAFALGIAGCANDAVRGPTAPLRSPSRSVVFDGAGDPCSFVLHNQSGAERQTLFSGAVLAAIVNDYWQPVVDNCPLGQPNLTDADLALAREAMIRYIKRTIELLQSDNVKAPSDNEPPTPFASKEAALVDHWNTMFAFVGYARPNLPALVLEPGGIAKVIFNDTPCGEAVGLHPCPGRELDLPNAAAMTVPMQTDGLGDTRGHLFTIYPVSAGCLVGSNLVQTGPCFQFSANPKADPKFSPKIQVGICEPVIGGNPISGIAPALGHLDDNVTKIAATVAGPYPVGCIDGGVASAGSWTGGIGDIVKRLASLATQAIGVSPAYAAHGGLGGVSEELSPFSKTETTISKATFTSAAGAPPGPPEAGTLSMILSRQSSILVQSSLGDLLNSPVVLNQGGGNCGSCGGLELRFTVGGAGGLLPTDGRYLVSWRSLQSRPTTKNSPFVLRASNGDEIARVTYASKSSKDQLLYNGVVVGSWTRNKQQKFEITVDLNNHVTALSIDGVVVAQNVSFSAANLARIAAEFSGIDAGIMGWDDVMIVRLADP